VQITQIQYGEFIQSMCSYLRSGRSRNLDKGC